MNTYESTHRAHQVGLTPDGDVEWANMANALGTWIYVDDIDGFCLLRDHDARMLLERGETASDA